MTICRPCVLTFEFLFCIRSKFAVSLVASTLQNQDSMELSLHRNLALCFTSHGRSIITRIRERNFGGLLRIKNIACGAFLERIMPNENGGVTSSLVPLNLCVTFFTLFVIQYSTVPTTSENFSSKSTTASAILFNCSDAGESGTSVLIGET